MSTAPALLGSKSVARTQTTPEAHARVHDHARQSISQHQSFEMVQTLLLSSIATLAYLRQLLPFDCFKKCDYSVVPTTSYIPYASLIDEFEHVYNGTKSKNSWQLMVLVRGKNSAADKILSWLDGIFEAISKKALAAVQLSVIVDKERPLEVVELYRYSFKYASNGTTNMVFSGPQGKPVTVASARSDFAKIIRNLVTLNITLPELPHTRFLNAHLFYTENCPHNYEPTGFRPCPNPKICVPNNEMWQMQDFSLGSMDSGFHSVGFDIGHLVFFGDDDSPGDAMRIPPDIAYKKPRSIVNGMDKNDSLDEHSPQESVIADIRNAQATESHLNPQTVSLIQTQILPARSFTQPESSTEWNLNTNRYSELLESKQELVNYRSENSVVVGENEVRCECTHNRDEGNMVQCDICDYWQHYHCYGFQSRKPKEIHVCYSCLIVSSDKPRLQDLMDLARYRRALWFLYGQDSGQSQDYPKSLTSYGKMIGGSLESTRAITYRLREEGFLPRAKSKFKAVDTVEQLEQMAEIYFDPMTLIKGYYDPRPLARSEVNLDLQTEGTAARDLQYAISRPASPAPTSGSETVTEELVDISPRPMLPRQHFQDPASAQRKSLSMLPHGGPRTLSQNPASPEAISARCVAVRSSPRIDALKRKRAEESTPWPKQIKSSHAISPVDARHFGSPD